MRSSMLPNSLSRLESERGNRGVHVESERVIKHLRSNTIAPPFAPAARGPRMGHRWEKCANCAPPNDAASLDTLGRAERARARQAAILRQVSHPWILDSYRKFQWLPSKPRPTHLLLLAAPWSSDNLCGATLRTIG